VLHRPVELARVFGNFNPSASNLSKPDFRELQPSVRFVL
jgi:hypothetical protein